MASDFIIVLAWPEGYVKAANAWYDKFFSINGKYRVGHSAAVLINSNTKTVEIVRKSIAQLENDNCNQMLRRITNNPMKT